MPTISLGVTTKWAKISSGTNDATCDVESGSIFLVDSGNRPPVDAKGHSLKEGMFANITPPTIAWVRSDGTEPAHVVLTTTV